MNYHLAQLNVAKARYPIADQRMKEFVELLASVNASGECAKGFVWLLKDETGTAVNFNLFDDPQLLVNMSVWESLDDLRNFAYSDIHGEVFRRRKVWFDPIENESTVLWWVENGHIPSVDEGKEKMLKLWHSGPSLEAFSLKKIYMPNS